MAEREGKKTPRDILRIFFRRRFVFALGAALFAIAWLVGAQRFVGVKYNGTAFFERRRGMTADLGLSEASEPYMQEMKLKLHREFTGREAVERVLEELGLFRGLPRDPDDPTRLAPPGQAGKQQIVNEVRKNIEIGWPVGSRHMDVVSVKFSHEDPKLTREIPNALVRNYREKVFAGIIEDLQDKKAFLEKKADRKENRLSALMGDLLELEREYPELVLVGSDELEQRIREKQQRCDNLRVQLEIVELMLARLNALGQTTTGPSTLVTGLNPELQRLEDQLREYRERLGDAITLNRMTGKHPTVATLREKIAQLEKHIEGTSKWIEVERVYEPGPRAGANQLQFHISMDQAMARKNSIAEEIKGLEREARELRTLKDEKFVPIRRQYKQKLDEAAEVRKELAIFKKSLSDVELAMEAEIDRRKQQKEEVWAAREQYRPSSPTLRTVLGGAIFGGLAFGGGLVFLFNFLDRSITTTEDAMRHFDLPVYGVIGRIVSRRERLTSRIRRWIVIPIVAIIALGCLSLCMWSVVLWLQYPDKYKQWLDFARVMSP